MKKYRFLIFVIFIIIVVLIFLPSDSVRPVRNIFYQTVRPFSIAGSYLSNRAYSFFGYFFHLTSMARENKALIEENLELQSQLAITKEVQHENEVLKKELGFINKKEEMKLMPSSIIGRSSSGFMRSIIIDRGSKDGIKSGQGVVSQGFLVGTVKQVYDNSSEVVLINNYNSLVPVILQDSRGSGLLRGGISGLTAEDIPLNIDIKTGEKVVTSGLGGEIPAGILIGDVENVISKKSEIFQKVSVKTPVEFYLLEFVFVMQ